MGINAWMFFVVFTFNTLCETTTAANPSCGLLNKGSNTWGPDINKKPPQHISNSNFPARNCWWGASPHHNRNTSSSPIFYLINVHLSCPPVPSPSTSLAANYPASQNLYSRNPKSSSSPGTLFRPPTPAIHPKHHFYSPAKHFYTWSERCNQGGKNDWTYYKQSTLTYQGNVKDENKRHQMLNETSDITSSQTLSPPDIQHYFLISQSPSTQALSLYRKPAPKPRPLSPLSFSSRFHQSASSSTMATHLSGSKPS